MRIKVSEKSDLHDQANSGAGNPAGI